jgi:hypothetical protein
MEDATGPAAAPWEFTLADKIQQKAAGSSGILRYLQRHVRYSDHSPPNSILSVDFRRSIAEFNVPVTDASYDAVTAGCITPGSPGYLSMRALSRRLSNLALCGTGGGAGAGHGHGSVPPSPLTGQSIPRVTVDVHQRARERVAW